ncbi:toxin-antitoxin system HicB family antitoxin [Virgibacillus sp. CBA3643]|uniref:toxin-antitoxin system HicB family antitoxin n=1 Tax=Virgibacillus sp. CBA3643 TaxID=2942278 RepID=UPI0035A34010
MSKDLKYYLSLDYNIDLQPIAEEDGGGWLASLPELEGCMSDGATQTEALKNLEDAKVDWLEFCIENSLPIPEPKIYTNEYSGKFTLRVGKTVHKKLVKASEQEGVSVNNLVNGFVNAGLQETVGSNYFPELVKEKPYSYYRVKDNKRPGKE